VKVINELVLQLSPAGTQLSVSYHHDTVLRT